MDGIRSPRAIFDFPAVALTLIFALLMSTAPPALAQHGQDATSAPVPLSQLADIIENKDSRSKLIAELRHAAAAQTPAENSTGAVQSKKKATAAKGKNAGTNVPAATAAERAKASGHQVSFARRFARTSSAWAESIGARISNSWVMLAALNQKRSPGPTFNATAFLNATITFSLVAISTIVAFFVLRLLAGTIFSAIDRFSRKAESGSGILIRRGTSILLAAAVDVTVVVLAAWAGYLAGLYAFGDSGRVGMRESLFINAFALVEFAKVAIRTVFAARYESLRLINMPSAIASWWSTRLCWFVGIIGYGLLVLVPVVNVQLSYFMGAAVSFLIMGGAYIYAMLVIFRNRKLLTERLTALAEATSVGFFSVLYRLFSRLWTLLAIAYFTTLFVVSQVDPTGALPFMMSATLQTLLAAAIGFGLSGLLSKAIGKRFTLSEGIHARVPKLEERVNSYVPATLKVIRVIILVVFAMVVASAWHVIDFGAWLASDPGVATVAALTRVGVVLLGAAFIWLVASSLIEHSLSPNTGKGAPTPRQETLMQLFGNALAIVIITMTLMISLSQIGVDIGPLIAGAGVLGLAIGFGAQTLVKDIITGVFIQMENGMNTGDVVNLAGTWGTVEHMTIRSVSLRDIDGGFHIIPFSSVTTVSNYMRDFAYHRFEYRVAYREDIDNVIFHLREAFKELKANPDVGRNILEDMTVPGVTALDENSVKIRIMIKTVAGAQWGVGRAFNRLVKMHFDRAGIEIPVLQHTLYFGEDRDGNAPAANMRMVEGPSANGNAPATAKRRLRGDDAAPEETGDAPPGD